MKRAHKLHLSDKIRDKGEVLELHTIRKAGGVRTVAAIYEAPHTATGKAVAYMEWNEFVRIER